MSLEEALGTTNVTVSSVETLTGHDGYGDPIFTTTTVNAPFWFEEDRGEEPSVEGVKRWDATLIGKLNTAVTEQMVVVLSDGTKWKVVDYSRLQAFDLEGDGSNGELRLELRVTRQRD